MNTQARKTIEPLEVLVLMGGPSNEREVSLSSGAEVAAALESRGHRVLRGDISPHDVSALDSGSPDVVFIAMHGEFGEDGQVQRLCAARGLPYVGSPPAACELAMDKAASKSVFRRAGLATPDWLVVEEYDSPAGRKEKLTRLGLPCVVKPVAGGSSLDLYIVRDEETLEIRLQRLLDCYGRALVERFVQGREFTVAVLGDRPLPLLEIVPASEHEFFDYESKYSDENTVYNFDHGLDASLEQAMCHDALRAHQLLGCRDFSRADFMLDAAGVAWLLETNAIPGLTSHSLVPKAAARTGMDFPAMCDLLVRAALDRGPDADGDVACGAAVCDNTETTKNPGGAN